MLLITNLIWNTIEAKVRDMIVNEINVDPKTSDDGNCQSLEIERLRKEVDELKETRQLLKS